MIYQIQILKDKKSTSEHELIAEELSGETLIVEISAKTKKNIPKLLESIILQSELLDLKLILIGKQMV